MRLFSIIGNYRTVQLRSLLVRLLGTAVISHWRCVS